MWYEPTPDADTFDSLSFCNPEKDIPLYLELVTQHYRFGERIHWPQFDVKINSESNPGDFLGFMASNDLVLTKRSWEALRCLIKMDVKLTVLRTTNEEFYWLKVMSIIDALDYEKAKYHKRTAEKIGVEFYVFKEEMIAGKHIFYLPRASHLVISQTFKDFVEKFELKGLIFKKLC
jgi:hypothetical protein